MNLKFVCLLLLLLVLRAGLVKSIDEIESVNNNNATKSDYPTLKEKPSKNLTSGIPLDRCLESGEINSCTSEIPYCYVDKDNIYCGPTDKSGWRISPLDGLVLNNGQIPNPNCELFNPPEKSENKEIIMSLLNYSEFGIGYEGRESAWFNIFEYLGNCPSKSQYCDKDSLTCQNLFDTGMNCTSSNQCLSRYCEKYDQNAPDDTTERRCVKVNDTSRQNNVSVSGGDSGKNGNSGDDSGKNGNSGSDSGKSGYSGSDSRKNGYGSLLIIISISVGSSILILMIIIFLIKVRRKNKFLLNSSNQSFPSNYLLNNDTTINQPRSVAKNFSLSSLQSSLFSRLSSNRPYSRNVKRDSSDQFSVLLPPPPTINRDVFLYRNNNINNHHNHYHLDDDDDNDDISVRDSFDIYPPNHIQQQYETSFIY